MEQTWSSIMSIILFALAFLLYFLPAYVGRNKSNSGAILVLNILLGWTLLGWIVALAWATSGDDINTSTKPDNSISPTDELLKLASLKEKGLLSDEEFNDAKAKLLK